MKCPSCGKGVILEERDVKVFHKISKWDIDEKGVLTYETLKKKRLETPASPSRFECDACPASWESREGLAEAVKAHTEDQRSTDCPSPGLS